MQRRSLGQRRTSTRKGKGPRACRQSRARREEAETVARRDPRDRATAGLLKVQCPSVKGGPLAPASQRPVDSAPRQADGWGDLCGSSTVPGGRKRHEWTASLTRERVAGGHCGRAYGARARGARSCQRSRRTGKPPAGRRAAGFPGQRGYGYARCREPVPPEARELESRIRRKYSVRFGGGPGEKAAMTSLAVYPTSCLAPASGSR
jgi:hypothetical protein